MKWTTRWFKSSRKKPPGLPAEGSVSSGETDSSQLSSPSTIRVIPADDQMEEEENEQHETTMTSTTPTATTTQSFWNHFFCFLPADLMDAEEEIRIRRQKRQIKALPEIECVYDDVNPTDHDSTATTTTESEESCCKCCCNGTYGLPPLNPTRDWPQAPLLFRPKPNSGTKIIGIRRDKDDTEYLWKPGMERPWWQTLQEEWGKNESGTSSTRFETPVAPFCECCVILPINNGNEAKGESLVADFESSVFRGSLLLRLRHAEGTTKEPSDDTKGFFAGVPFRYQATIRGTFLENLPWTELMTGTRLDRPPGKTPPKWLMWTALKVGTQRKDYCPCMHREAHQSYTWSFLFAVHFFAPQLQTRLDCERPYSISPLGSAPRTVTVTDGKPSDFLGDDREEPTTPEQSLTGTAYPIKDALERARARKKHFDKLFGAKNKKDVLMTGDKTYTFQFLQHLFDYKTTSIDLGSFHHDLNDLLDGQPLQLMAEHGDTVLWDFEIWNEILLNDAKKHMT
eukprot:scaffold9523_cov103-Cylindrotheca_fusiformis.AAC.11